MSVFQGAFAMLQEPFGSFVQWACPNAFNTRLWNTAFQRLRGLQLLFDFTAEIGCGRKVLPIAEHR